MGNRYGGTGEMNQGAMVGRNASTFTLSEHARIAFRAVDGSASPLRAVAPHSCDMECIAGLQQTYIAR